MVVCYVKDTIFAPRTCAVALGKTKKHQEHLATFTQYPIVEHKKAASEREVNANIGALEVTLGGGVRQLSSAVGGGLASAGEKITTKVARGTYEDVEVSCDVKEHLQMNVRVGVLRDLTGTGVCLRGKLQLLDVKKVSGNKVLVLRQPRLNIPSEYNQIDWPCSPEQICSVPTLAVGATARATRDRCRLS